MRAQVTRLTTILVLFMVCRPALALGQSPTQVLRRTHKKINALLREVEAEATADQYPMVALSNVPGAGGTTQELIVMDLNDFANLLDVICDGTER